MSEDAVYAWLRRRPWLTYLVVVAVALCVKWYYSRATVRALGWILEPTARLVGWLSHQTLVLDGERGWVASDGSFIIAPACAGVNFLTLLIAVGGLGFAHRFARAQQHVAWVLVVLCGAYLSTIVVNTLRILVTVALYAGDVDAWWFTPERVHRIAGTLIYLVALWCAGNVLDRLSAWLGRTAPARGGWPVIALTAAYLGVTVVAPLLNGAWRQFGTQYLEHALTVSLLAMVVLPLLSLIQRLRLFSTGRRARLLDRPADRGQLRWESR